MSTALAHARKLLDWVRALEAPRFVALVVVCMIAIRLLLIHGSQHQNGNIDLSIYREAGQLVLAGVDPYDFSAKREMRERLRTDGAGASAWVSETQERYDYYVSSNPPGSTLLYAALEFASRGNPYFWRIYFLLGDVAVALAAYYLLRSAGNSFDTDATKLAYAALALAYPSLLIWGTVIPQDKQFQTALMMLFAGLLIAPAAAKPSLRRATAIGAVGALSIVFKALGGILLPLMATVLARMRRLEQIAAFLVFLVVVMLLSLAFSDSFFQLTLDRALRASSLRSTAIHSSPWIFFPSAAQAVYPKVAIALGATLCCLWAYMRRRIDLLNTLAGLLVVYLCIWVTSGSMDRMNIAMIFALMCIATISLQLWQRLVLTNAAVQLAVYGTGLGLFRASYEACDAISCLAFLTVYFFTILRVSLQTGTLVSTVPSRSR